MKVIFALLILYPFIGYSQNGTSLEEYNYCTKGYKIQIESGLDPVKKGYEIKSLHEMDIDYSGFNINISFIGFIKIASQELRATIMIIKSSEGVFYLCVPNEDSNEDVFDLYFNAFVSTKPIYKNAVFLALSEYLQIIGDINPKPTSIKKIKRLEKPVGSFKN